MYLYIYIYMIYIYIFSLYSLFGTFRYISIYIYSDIANQSNSRKC